MNKSLPLAAALFAAAALHALPALAQAVPAKLVPAQSEISFVIKRLDFKIGEEEWTDTTVVANDVTVKFKLALSGLGPL